MFCPVTLRLVPSTDEAVLNSVFTRIRWECEDMADQMANQEENEDE